MVVGLPGRSIHEIGASLPSQKLTFIAPVRKRAQKETHQGGYTIYLPSNLQSKINHGSTQKSTSSPHQSNNLNGFLLVIQLENSNGLDNPGCCGKDMVGESNIFKNHVYHLYVGS